MTLDVVVRVAGEVANQGWALNEASLEKASAGRAGCRGGDRRQTGFGVRLRWCAGLNPTGSTAYAFSAGGPVVWPALEAIIGCRTTPTPCSARPMVTNPNSMIAIEIEPDSHDALVFCDGRREMRVPPVGGLEVTKCGTPLKWVRLDSARSPIGWCASSGCRSPAGGAVSSDARRDQDRVAGRNQQCHS